MNVNLANDVSAKSRMMRVVVLIDFPILTELHERILLWKAALNAYIPPQSLIKGTGFIAANRISRQ